MRLPSSLSKVITNYERESARKRLGANLSIREDANRHIIELAKKTDDKEVLAYLWLALELNYNVLVLAKKAERRQAGSFIDAISAFVPFHKTVLDLSAHTDRDRRINFLSINPKIKKGDTNLIINRLMPDMIITKSADNLRNLFHNATYGINFIALLEGNFYNRQIVKMLQSKYFGVKKEDISMLDISVFLEADKGSCKISAITEYKWLDREFKSKDPSFKKFKNIQITNGQTNNIRNSKLVENYCKSNLVSVDEAMEELTRRVEFLNDFIKESKNKEIRPIEMYYEIK